MTTLKVRPAYTIEELAELYPSNLILEQVQLIFRHGERTPVSARFQDLGLPIYWPYCHVTKQLRASILNNDASWSILPYERMLETYDRKPHLKFTHGPTGKPENICLAGELTDRGRETTLTLGQRLRHLYMEQLQFLPTELENTSSIYLRATPVPRARESLQQVFTGMFPKGSILASAGTPKIWARNIADENLVPNETVCRRYRQLQDAFATAAANKWNDSAELKYITSKIGGYMADGVVKIDGSPRLSGIMDTVASTNAHGPMTKLPPVFYEAAIWKKAEKAVVEEWFLGYEESLEVRRLGVGSLLGDVRDRMLQMSAGKRSVGGEQPIKLALMGCHDTTIGGVLAALGAFDWKWPPYTSSIAVELFSSTEKPPTGPRSAVASWFKPSVDSPQLRGWYVRMRYNDTPVQIRYCRAAGKHLEGNPQFCTLEAFKEVVDKISPEDWRAECLPIPDAKKGELPPLQKAE